MRKLWTIRWFRVLLGVVLTAALLAPVVLPALQMQRQEPETRSERRISSRCAD